MTTAVVPVVAVSVAVAVPVVEPTMKYPLLLPGRTVP